MSRPSFQLATVEVALRHVQQKIEKLRLSAWLSVSSEGRTLSVVRDEDSLAEVTKLDGCYAGGILFCRRVALETTRKNQLEPDISKWPCHIA